MAYKKTVIRTLAIAMSLLSLPVMTLLSQDSQLPGVGSSERKFTADQWLEDLDFVLTKLKEMHPNIYYRISSEDFARTVENSRSSIKQSATDAECYIAIRKVVASICDGHTTLGYSDAVNFLANKLPVKIDCFTDGYFISAVEQKNKELLGLKVTAVDGVKIEEAMQRAMDITCMDNQFGRKNRARGVLRYPILLKGLGIINNENSVTFTLANAAGKSFEHGFSSKQDYREDDLFTIQSFLGNDLPLYLKNVKRNYWFEHLNDDNILFAQINVIEDQDNGKTESFISFTENLFNYFDTHSTEIDKLVIDLRNNPGGNGRMAVPFIKEIIKRDRIDTRGRLFILIGKETYSAAVVMATELLQYTEAIFVGDPPGCPSNLFSNSKPAGNLPNTGCPFNVATRLIDNGWTLNREYFLPDVPAMFSSREFLSGEDPALSAITAGEALPIDYIAIEQGADKALSAFFNLLATYPELPGWRKMVEDKINLAGYTFLKESYYAEDPGVKALSYSKAEPLFILNTQLFPGSSNAFESLGEAFLVNGQRDRAQKSFEKSLELDPDNREARRMLERLKN